MTSEPRYDSAEFDEQDTRVFFLAGVLEAYAQAYSADYAEEIDDGCGAAIRSIDYGGKLTTSVEFTAERYRDESIPDLPSEELARKYDITSSIRHECPDYLSLPAWVREYVEELGDYGREDLEGYESLIALEFEQTYTIYSDGGFEYEQYLWLIIGEDRLSLDDSLQEKSEPGYDLDEIITQSDMDDDLFSTIFSADEISFIGEAIKRVKYDQSSERILDMFLEQVAAIRFITTQRKLEMAESLVDGIFCDTSQG